MALEKYVSEILEDIRNRGRQAVKEYAAKFDDYRGEFPVGKSGWDRVEDISQEDKAVIREVVERVRKHHENQLPEDQLRSGEGSLYGTIYRPLERVGLYVPGGTPLPSSLIMTAVPARLAGVEKIIVTSPPTDGKISPYLLYVARLLDIDHVYKVGGVQAIGAMATGSGVERVDKIFGPGNRFVTEAKRQVYGEVGIHSLAGPSDICIIADHSAPEDAVLWDLKSQIEHGPESKAWLLTTSPTLGDKCDLDSVQVEVTQSLQDCVRKSNEIAPEHLEVLTANPLDILDSIDHAGAIYLGNYTPVAAGDYFLGVNHVLPTGGTARFDSVLTVPDFLKPISVAYSSKREFKAKSFLGERLADIEGMEAHRKALEVRKDAEKD